MVTRFEGDMVSKLVSLKKFGRKKIDISEYKGLVFVKRFLFIVRMVLTSGMATSLVFS